MTVSGAESTVEFEVDGAAVEVSDEGSLLEALRDRLGLRSVKDGCSPQGQCGCCTVLVDGTPRVACVTPVGRVRGRRVTTVDGLPGASSWADAFAACGASQCGFCTPGIITRLSALDADRLGDRATVDRALLAHLCRCTGWQPVRDAAAAIAARAGSEPSGDADVRDAAAASRRAELEGGVAQLVGPGVALGRGGFADDDAPLDALIAVRAVGDTWAVGATLSEARAAAGKVQGRRTTAPVEWPIEVPSGDWTVRLQTTWVEPAYLEPDAAWCDPGGRPSSSLGNGGAFGGKSSTDAGEVARRLADEHQRPVRVLWSREDVVRFGPKRPPIALGIRADGTGVVHAARPRGASSAALDAVRASMPDHVELDWVDVDGPSVSLDLRAAVWAEVAAAHAVATGATEIVAPSGARAAARITDEAVHIEVSCGDPLDEAVLRSYCSGAAHMALGMVRSESLALDAVGHPADLTIRSFGVLRAVDTPELHVSIVPVGGPASTGSDAVFAAVLAAAWRAAGTPPRWPV